LLTILKGLRMFGIFRFFLTTAALLCCQIAVAEPTTKCTDGNQITYANMPCESLGLKSAGPIRNAVTVVPAQSIIKGKSTEGPSGKEKKFERDTSEAGKQGTSKADAPPPDKHSPISDLIDSIKK
jgi:hypothetical protein